MRVRYTFKSGRGAISTPILTAETYRPQRLSSIALLTEALCRAALLSAVAELADCCVLISYYYCVARVRFVLITLIGLRR